MGQGHPRQATVVGAGEGQGWGNPANYLRGLSRARRGEVQEGSEAAEQITTWSPARAGNFRSELRPGGMVLGALHRRWPPWVGPQGCLGVRGDKTEAENPEGDERELSRRTLGVRSHSAPWTNSC